MNIEKIREDIKKYFIGKFDIPEVISYIDEINSFKIMKYKNLTLKLYYNTNDNLDFEFIKKVMKRGVFILKGKLITIHLIPSHAKKILKEDGIMTSENINSGFTFIKRNDIFIFRKEEFPKVILHELIHHDLNIHQELFKKENEIKLKEHFNLCDETLLILNEAIIELWATILQLAFVSIDYHYEFRKIFKMELNYSLYKCYQIFKIQKGEKWNDKCSIYSYIIFKTILLYYLNDYIKIYMYPNKYDDTTLTDFLINHSKIPEINKNPEFSSKIKRPDNSLCFMLFSDY
jgi:hypothetical protein